MAQPTEVAAAGRDSDVLGELHAHATSADDAKVASPPVVEESGERETVSVEISGEALAAPAPPLSLDGGVTGDLALAEGESDGDDGDPFVVTANGFPTCSVCKEPAMGDVDVCSGCGMAVHSACYAGEPPRQSPGSGKHAQKKRRVQRDVAESGTAGESDASMESAEWKCDCCVHEVTAAEELVCVFCEQPGGSHMMKLVDTQPWGEPWTTSSESHKHFAHVLCSRWDPFAFEQQLLDQNNQLQLQLQQEESLQQQKQHVKPHELTKDEAATPSTPQQTRNHRLNQPDAPSVVEPATEPPAGLEAEPPAMTPLSEHIAVAVYEPNVSLALPTACCFCASTAGVRIQCHRVDCGSFFHAFCAHERNGRLDICVLPYAPSLVEYHAYCNRHRECTESAAMVVDWMLTKPVTSLTGRDAVLRFLTVKRRLEANAFPTIHAFLHAIVTVLTDLCKNGLKKSKTDPPTYSMKHLQVLQLFLDRVPQLQAVYHAPFPRQLPLGDDSTQLYALLQKTFDPVRLLGKFAGPVSQLHTCAVCALPFNKRQHLLYCTNPDTPHVQHWKCTKRRSTSREREKIAASLAATGANGGSTGLTSAKKKLSSLALVLDGKVCDVKLPKGLPGVSDDLICALCRCDVDASGLLASRKEGKRADFAPKRSDFVLGGCFANARDLPTVSISSTMALPAKATTTTVELKLLSVGGMTTVKAVKASDRSRKRSAGELSGAKPLVSSVFAPAAAVAPLATTATAAPLGPPKIERIQVQRTTKWLAHVAQIIRLAGALTKLSPKPVVGMAEEDGTVPAPPSGPAPVTEQSAVAPTTAASRAPLERQDAASLRVQLAMTTEHPSSDDRMRLARLIDAHFTEAIAVVRPFDADAYVLARLETARSYWRTRSGPAIGVLRMLAHEYTRIVYVKHTRAVEKAANEKRKRAELDAREQREQLRKRQALEAEAALKSQMEAIRLKKRKLVKTG